MTWQRAKGVFLAILFVVIGSVIGVLATIAVSLSTNNEVSNCRAKLSADFFEALAVDKATQDQLVISLAQPNPQAELPQRIEELRISSTNLLEQVRLRQEFEANPTGEC